jgi:hypothetical protein
MKKEYVFEEFQKEYKLPSVKGYDMVMELVNANKQVRKWYSELKRETTTLVEMPQALKDAGMTTEQWDSLSVEREILKNSNRVYSNAASEAAKIFKTAMDLADKNRITELSKVSMLTRITSLTFNELPIISQIEILSEKDKDKRNELTKLRVNAMITSYARDLMQKKEIKDPFE